MKKFFVLFVLVFGFAFGQSFENWGVERETDSFDGFTICSQTLIGEIDGVEVGVTYANADQGLPSLLTIAVVTEEPVFNIYGPVSGEQVRVKLSNDETTEVFDLSIGQLDSEISGGNWFQFIIVPFESVSSLEVMTYFEGDVMIRLDGSNYNYDFVLPEEWRAVFASEFLLECAPKTDWESS